MAVLPSKDFETCTIRYFIVFLDCNLHKVPQECVKEFAQAHMLEKHDFVTAGAFELHPGVPDILVPMSQTLGQS